MDDLEEGGEERSLENNPTKKGGTPSGLMVRRRNLEVKSGDREFVPSDLQHPFNVVLQ